MRVPFERLPGWVERYDAAHPGTSWTVDPAWVEARSPDGSQASFDVPFGALDEPTLDGCHRHLGRSWRIGVVLVRRGGYAVARLSGATLEASTIGRRHVQGRTKAGGWSQQRFARRRSNQAKAAFDAAALHVADLLVAGQARLDLLGVGGDRQAIAAVLDHPELRRLRTVPQVWLGGVPDPTRAVLERAVADVRSVQISITDPDPST